MLTPWIDGTLLAVSEIWPAPHPDSSSPAAAAIPGSSTAARREPLIERVTSVLLVTITPATPPDPLAMPVQTALQGSWG
ncbi:hypothetical protein Xph01_00180 [Micromonospora phaseoli]|nr:hypothetical protein Xph01_00180 [Micromonospora phaseoli]